MQKNMNVQSSEAFKKAQLQKFLHGVLLLAFSLSSASCKVKGAASEQKELHGLHSVLLSSLQSILQFTGWGMPVQVLASMLKYYLDIFNVSVTKKLF